jgi:hypothetical protein
MLRTFGVSFCTIFAAALIGCYEDHRAREDLVENGGTGDRSTDDSSSGSNTTGDSSAGDASTDDSSTSGCVDVCELYGPPCCVWSEACIEAEESCVFEVLSARVDVIYEYQDLEQAVISIPQDVLVSFTDTDIEWAAAEPPAASRIEMHLTPQASSLHGAVLENASLHPFRISCGGESLFVGVIYEMIGAAGIRTPVLHVARDSVDNVVLYLGAWQGAWVASMSMEYTAARDRIDRSELRAVFCQRGALRELDPNALPFGI